MVEPSGARNMAIVVHENELARWFDDDATAKASPAERSAFFQTAREQLEPYQQVFAPFSGTAEVFPGVRPVPLFGHTPGHCGYMISSQDQRLLPPVRARSGQIDDELRSNPRPIELIDSPRCQ